MDVDYSKVVTKFCRAAYINSHENITEKKEALREKIRELKKIHLKKAKAKFGKANPDYKQFYEELKRHS